MARPVRPRKASRAKSPKNPPSKLDETGKLKGFPDDVGASSNIHNNKKVSTKEVSSTKLPPSSIDDASKHFPYGPTDLATNAPTSGYRPLWKVARERAMMWASLWCLSPGAAFYLFSNKDCGFPLWGNDHAFALWHLGLALCSFENWRVHLLRGWRAWLDRIFATVSISTYVHRLTAGTSIGAVSPVSPLLAFLLFASLFYHFRSSMAFHKECRENPNNHHAHQMAFAHHVTFRHVSCCLAFLAAVGGGESKGMVSAFLPHAVLPREMFDNLNAGKIRQSQ